MHFSANRIGAEHTPRNDQREFCTRGKRSEHQHARKAGRVTTGDFLNDGRIAFRQGLTQLTPELSRVLESMS